MIEKAKSGIQLKKVILLKSEYRRENYLSELEHSNITFNISLRDAQRDNEIEVIVDVTLQAKETDKENDFRIHVSTLGLFEQIGEVSFSLDQFVRVNGPAIVYPYIRQHIRSLTLESGINPIILPIINFQLWYDEEKKHRK